MVSPCALAVGLLCLTGAAGAKTWTFDPNMLGDSGSHNNVDIGLFNQGLQQPGVYTVDIVLNGSRIDSRDVVFSLRKDPGGNAFLYPCLPVTLLSQYGIRTEDYPALSGSGTCAQLDAIAQASYDFQFSTQQLLLSIPQASLRPTITGIAPQSLWNDGIPALLLNYSANTSRAIYRDAGAESREASSTYLQLNPGGNLGPWRIRNQSNWQKSSDTAGKWQTVYTYAERGLYDSKSRVTLGDRYTPGDVFESVPFRGVMLGSDDNMIPLNQRAYSPVIRGVARTQARVEVKQNGYTLYSTTVAPGPFALTDLTNTGSTGGDLQVTVWETDGHPQVFTVPYQTPAIALKEGYLKYNVMGGTYRPSGSKSDTTKVVQGTVQYGLPRDLTAYGGVQIAEHYQANATGLGLSLGDWGAVSADLTMARSQSRQQARNEGERMRVRYSKEVAATATRLAFTGEQYSPGYRDLSDVLDTWRSSERDGWGRSSDAAPRQSTLSVTLDQQLGDWGSIGLNASRAGFRGQARHDNSIGVSYGVGLFSGVSMSLNWSANKQVNGRGDTRTNRVASLWFSVPLRGLPASTAYATYQMTSEHGGSTQEAGLSGEALDRQLHWDVSQRHAAPGLVGRGRDSSNLHLTGYGTYGTVGGDYSYGPRLRQMSASVSGGMVVHQQGVTLSQTLGDTIALVEAPGVAGVRVGGGAGVKTDFRGYTNQAWLTPYQDNTVSLDPLSLPDDVDITQTDTHVVPTQGAVVPAAFATRMGGRALMVLTREEGEPVPFGTLVMLEGQGGSAGIMGRDGQVYLTGLPDAGTVVAKWGTTTCRAHYTLPAKAGVSGVYTLRRLCNRSGRP